MFSHDAGKPVEGIEAAIRTFYSQDKKTSLSVFGDEFTGDSVDDALRSVERLNHPDRSGQRRLRIHAIGFPTIFSQARYRRTLCHAHAPAVRAERRGLHRPQQPEAVGGREPARTPSPGRRKLSIIVIGVRPS